MSLNGKIKYINSKIRKLKSENLLDFNKYRAKKIKKLEKNKDQLRKQTDFYKKNQEKKLVLQREKKNISSKITRLSKKFEKSTNKKEQKSILSKISRLEKKKDKVSVKIFKKTDKSYYLKKNLHDLEWKYNKIKEIVSDSEINLSKSRKLDLLKEIRDLGLDIDTLRSVLDLPIKDIDSSGVVFMDENDYEGEPDEYLPWEMKEKISTRIDSGKFDTILIKLPYPSEEFDVSELIQIEKKVDELEKYVYKVTDHRKGSTARVPVLYDFQKRRIILG